MQWHPQAPTNSKLLEGRWRLLFTTRPGSASPIQRTFTGVDAFTVYQEILFSTPAGARVNNIVDFGGRIGQLKVSHSLDISDYRMDEIVFLNIYACPSLPQVKIIVKPPCMHGFTILSARAQNPFVFADSHALTQAACIMAFLVMIYPELAASAVCSFSHQCTRVSFCFCQSSRMPECH